MFKRILLFSTATLAIFALLVSVGLARVGFESLRVFWALCGAIFLFLGVLSLRKWTEIRTQNKRGTTSVAIAAVVVGIAAFVIIDWEMFDGSLLRGGSDASTAFEPPAGAPTPEANTQADIAGAPATGAAPDTAGPPIASEAPLPKRPKGSRPARPPFAEAPAPDARTEALPTPAPLPEPAPPRNVGIAEFPWPPPDPSTQIVLPTDGLIKVQVDTLSTFNQRLNRALDLADYGDRRYYAVPRGFALVTRVERTDADGTPRKPPGRWLLDQSAAISFSISGLAEILTNFVNVPPGYYQVLVFVVTDVPFNSNERDIVTREQASAWLAGGTNVLPDSIGGMSWTSGTRCSALVYEFVKPAASEAASKAPVFRQTGRMSAKDHLIKASLWSALGDRS